MIRLYTQPVIYSILVIQWNTWVSCEEADGGQCWQIDPNPESPFHNSPKETLLGGNGGRFETVVSIQKRFLSSRCTTYMLMFLARSYSLHRHRRLTIAIPRDQYSSRQKM